jgi:hypothetical protein
MPILTGVMSQQVENELAQFMNRTGCDEIEAWRRILSLAKIANEAHDRGHCLGIIEEKDGEVKVIAKIKGL